MSHATFKVEGMHCTGCAATIQALLQWNEGVLSASASFDEGEARVLYDPAVISQDDLARAIEKAGYRIAEWRSRA
jgi:copper chaperone CopZ